MRKTLPKYPEYKESGVEWLGEIPGHWNVYRAKILFRDIDDRSETGREELLTVSHITGVTKRSEKDVTMFMAESFVGYKRCLRGDLAINTMWAWMGALGVSPIDGIVSPSYNVYRFRRIAHNPWYYDMLCRTRMFIIEMTRYSKGIRSNRLRLYPESFYEILIPYPSVEDQRAIVAFLDVETGKIDRLMGVRRRQIEVLREQRAAVIHHAVTQGLDPTAPMKDSGIEWLGKIPEHWEAWPLKFIATTIMGQSPQSSDCNDSGEGLPFLQGCAEFGETSPIPKMFCVKPSKVVESGDILLSVRAPVGDLNTADQAYGIGRGLCAVRGKKAEQKFLNYVLFSGVNYFHSIATGSTYEAISVSQVGGIRVPLPPEDEQQAIVAHIDRETAKIDALIGKYERELE